MPLFRKKDQNELIFDNLPISPDFRSEVKSAYHRISQDHYTDDDYGKSQKNTDLLIVRDAFHLGYQQSGGNLNNKSYLMISGRETPGYAQAGSILRKMYPNEFLLHAFLAEAYWASVKSRKELWVETDRDSYTLIASPSVPKKTIKQIYNTLEQLKVPFYRNKFRDSLLVFGNVVLVNKRNKFGGLLEFNPLLMEKVEARYDRNADQITGWDYTVGQKRFFIPYDNADHLKVYNARSNVIGTPCTNSIIVDIEAALQAAIYNNNLMQKGGLLKVLIGMKEPALGNIVNDKVQLNLAEEFQKWAERRFGGVRSAGQMAFIPMLDSVHILNKISEMDAAWTKLDDKTASKTSLLYGLYPERIGLARTTQYENKVLVTNDLALSLDNNNYYVQNIVDEYITRTVILEGMGIDNVKIQASGDFSAISKTAADTGLAIAQMGVDAVTVDEWRVEYMHVDPLGGELGQKFLGEFLRKIPPKGSPQLSQSDLDAIRVLGPSRQYIPEYREVECSFVKHKRKNIAFY